MTGSGDTRLALWKLPDLNSFGIVDFKAVAIESCKTECAHALAVNEKNLEIAALGLNGSIDLWKSDSLNYAIKPVIFISYEIV